MSSPIFSIVMPTYNRAWILPKTIEYIRQQDFSDWELIVVDDGSTDETRPIVEAIAQKDNRVRYVYQKNARQAAARQNGLTQAKGEWVSYVDSDEELYPYYLSTAYEFFKAHPEVWYAMAYMDRTIELHDKGHNLIASLQQPATELDPNKITLQDYAHWKIKPCGTGIFHRRDIIKDEIAWDTSFHIFEDVDFLFQLGVKYPEHFGFIARPIFHQRQVFGNDGLCGSTSYGDWAYGFEKWYLKYKDAWFMKGQQWYPKKVDEYRERQRLFEAGKFPSPCERYFPEYFKKD